eukprot:TRINITY_DN32084_c0_g1_i3.p1 TRINITY_DN32084_c0_g1~~TRINITY_DN32084_c0_g1_i3.p1  ORF type:complete len:476 (-),score=89.81 TRINITY_DN32084_c0_g1_i3:311-1738(-)
MGDADFLAALQEACGGDGTAIRTDDEALDEASRDRSFHEARRPRVVVTPSNVEQVAAVVKACVAARVPMVPRGAGTGVEGGAVVLGDAVVIVTERLKKMEVLEDDVPPMAVVGAGVYKDELNKFLQPRGLLFGPDPSSNPTVGGMASTGGSGMSTLRFGTTKENVISLLVVTANGDIVRTRRNVRKSSSGYELTHLYMGSEGTLGIICELTVRLQRHQAARSGGFLVFPDTGQAVQAVVETLRVDPPSLLRCEMLNAEGVRCTNAVFNTTLECHPTLFLELRGATLEALRKDFDTIVSIAARHGCKPEHAKFAADGAELDTLWEARRGCYIASMKYRGHPGGDYVFVTDVCVPTSRLAECVSASEADCIETGFPCVICAHIADGNFHCLVPYQPGEEGRLKEWEGRMMQRALEMGGTVTGEHGVGLGKIMHSCREHGLAHVAVQKSIKAALDPLGLMNPGKVLPTDDIEDLKARL